MFRETLQVLVCLSVLISSSVSLHMVRDAYHRPLSGLNQVHDDPVVLFNSKHNTGICRSPFIAAIRICYAVVLILRN